MEIDVREMALHDVDFGMTLKERAGWNQTRADWQRFIELQPGGCFIASLDGAPVGCGTSCILGDAGWIAMILVDPQARGKGVGTKIMRRLLAYLAENHVRTPRLDATDMGRPVYEKLGFEAEYKLVRMGGTLRQAAKGAEVQAASTEDLPDIAALDHRITGTDRGRLIERLMAENVESFHLCRDADGDIEGYVTWRAGEKAAQIGPCLALNASAGEALLGEALRRHAGQGVYVDVPVGNEAAVGLCAERGLKPLREFLRMFKGGRITDRPECMWATSGPEKG